MTRLVTAFSTCCSGKAVDCSKLVRNKSIQWIPDIINDKLPLISWSSEGMSRGDTSSSLSLFQHDMMSLITCHLWLHHWQKCEQEIIRFYLLTDVLTEYGQIVHKRDSRLSLRPLWRRATIANYVVSSMRCSYAGWCVLRSNADNVSDNACKVQLTYDKLSKMLYLYTCIINITSGKLLPEHSQAHECLPITIWILPPSWVKTKFTSDLNSLLLCHIGIDGYPIQLHESSRILCIASDRSLVLNLVILS